MSEPLDIDLSEHADETPAPVPTIEQEISEAVEGWIRDELHNGPIARNTEAMNHLTAAKGELKRRLTSLFLQGV